MLSLADARDRLRELVVAVEHADIRTQEQAARWFIGLSGKDILRLDEAARSGWPTLVDGDQPWSSNPADPTGLIMGLRSFHVNGRIRQRAVEELARTDSELSTAFLAVRCGDHVTQVRTLATTAIQERCDTANVVLTMRILLAGANRIWFREILDRFTTDVVVDTPNLQAALLESTDTPTRRWAVRHMIAANTLTPGDAAELAESAGDQLVTKWCSDYVGRSGDRSLLLPMLHAHSSQLRLTALTYLPPAELDAQSVQQLLADPTRRVQEAARWKAPHLGVDVVNVYRNLLTDHQPPRVTAAALVGLGATGSADDAGVVADCLSHASPRVRAEAAEALAGLVPFTDVQSVFETLLFDTSGRVTRAAASVFVRERVIPGCLTQAWDAEAAPTRRAAWRIQRSCGHWDRVVADLRAANDLDPMTAGLGQAGIRNWLEHSAATTWGTPSPAQQTIISASLETSTLPNDVSRVIAFHCGIRIERLSRNDNRTPDTHHQPPQRYAYERAAVFVAAMAVLWNFPIRSHNPGLCLIPIGLAAILTYIANRRAIRAGTSRRVTAAACILTITATMFLLINLVTQL